MAMAMAVIEIIDAFPAKRHHHHLIVTPFLLLPVGRLGGCGHSLSDLLFSLIFQDLSYNIRQIFFRTNHVIVIIAVGIIVFV
jgi:hypothetical protein